jgi:hypothetical protein
VSFPPITLDGIDINGLPESEPGGVVRSGSSLIVNNSYNDFRARSISRTPGFEFAANLRRSATGVLGNTTQAVDMGGTSRLTYGLDRGTPLPVGGVVVDASKAKQVIVTLGNDAIRNTASALVARRFIPQDVRTLGGQRRFNTLTRLSRGNDDFTGSRGRDLLLLNRGNNGAVLGRGKDLVVVDRPLRNSTVELGRGKDTMLLSGRGLNRKGQLTLTDFNNSADTIRLDTKRSRVSGLGTDTLKLSASKGGFLRLVSDRDPFSRSSVEFLG